MQVMGFWLGIIIAALLSAAVAAQEPEPPRRNLDEGRINSDPLKGLIINRTITVMGWDFYSSFTQVWQALYPESQDTMTIIERPTAQFGSEIWITYLNRNVFHTFLSPARSRAQDQSRKAVQAVRENIDIINAQRQFIQNADLGPEEM
ncbi:MAG: CsgE family curli-type amyloid fiber assembly protein [Castellaniella sp.]|uniref:CsgE family curli-type amyloid fiber assembly protein n=1 Tax=Castellaniella sp. TaxID=1955812 RepID=UPI002A35D734|nr:CsgE family curli-type amyloid fiber assembly protein [Castellaniella sp.]MDY0308462.1 CsgE family curli-type amyloid fiber assembly protein [Castellaniella sp.]